MPEFLCRIGNENGEIVEQIFHATDEKILREDLEKKNCHVFEIKKKGGPLKLSSLPIPGMKKKIKLQNFIIFNQELAVLLKAGLPLLNCLDILIERIEDPVFRDSLQEVRNQVQGGASLSEAFALQGDLYPKLYAPSLTAGERSGELVPVITRFVAYMKKINAIRKKILASLTYPAILITLSIFLVNIVIFYALPKFISFYEEFGEELPLPTTILRNTSIFLRENSLFVIGGIIIAYIAFTIWRNSDQGEVIMDRVKMKLPVLGDVFQIYHISQISRTLSTLIAGGIPVVTSMEISSTATANTLISKSIKKAAEEVREGKSLFDSLGATGFMLPMALEMIKVGESTGSLETMLTNIADFYDEQIDQRLTTLVTVFEPMILMFMGFLVAGMLISIYLPIFRLVQAVR